MEKIRIIIGASILLLVMTVGTVSASIIGISGDFTFDAGIYPDTYGQNASIKTGSYSLTFDTQTAVKSSYNNIPSLQTSNYSNSILNTSINFDGVKYETNANDSLQNTIAIWDRYTFYRDRISFIIGLGSVSAGYDGIAGDEIIYGGVSYSPNNDMSISLLRTSILISLYAEDFNAITSTDIPLPLDFETLFASSRSRVRVNSLYGTNGKFLNVGGDITSVNVSTVPEPPVIALMLAGFAGLGLVRRKWTLAFT